MGSEKRKNGEKRKNDDYFDSVIQQHVVLDGSVDQLRDVLHLQLEIHTSFRHGECTIDAIDQVAQLVEMVQRQIKIVLADELVEFTLNKRRQERAVEYEMIVKHYHLTALYPFIYDDDRT